MSRPPVSAAKALVFLMSLGCAIAVATESSPPSSRASLHQRIDAGHYRILALRTAPSKASAEEEPSVIATLMGTEKPNRIELTIPQKISTQENLQPNLGVIVKHRVYGLAIALSSNPERTIYIYLENDWEPKVEWTKIE